MTPEPVTPETLPYYLQGEALSFEREERMLTPRCGLDRARWVMTALAHAPAGRRQIEETLAASGHPLTEGEIRKILHLLQAAGLVNSKAGRQGSALTPRGHVYANGFNDRQAF